MERFKIKFSAKVNFKPIYSQYEELSNYKFHLGDVYNNECDKADRQKCSLTAKQAGDSFGTHLPNSVRTFTERL
jgi:hypothetical protein